MPIPKNKSWWEKKFDYEFIKSYPDGSERWLRGIGPDDIRDFITKVETKTRQDTIREVVEKLETEEYICPQCKNPSIRISRGSLERIKKKIINNL